jgi:hypothetical protein
MKAEVPEERLLVFNVKEGWGPLCRFLGKEGPREKVGKGVVPFPRLFDTDQYRELVDGIKAEKSEKMARRMMGLGVVAGGLGILGALILRRR